MSLNRLQLHRFAQNDKKCPHNLSRAHGTDESIGISGTKIMFALAIDVLNGKID